MVGTCLGLCVKIYNPLFTVYSIKFSSNDLKDYEVHIFPNVP